MHELSMMAHSLPVTRFLAFVFALKLTGRSTWLHLPDEAASSIVNESLLIAGSGVFQRGPLASMPVK